MTLKVIAFSKKNISHFSLRNKMWKNFWWKSRKKIPDYSHLCLINILSIFLSNCINFLRINSMHSTQLSKLLPLFLRKAFIVFFLFLFKHISLAGTCLILFGTFSLDLASCYCKKEDVHMVRLKSAALRRLRKFHIFF